MDNDEAADEHVDFSTLFARSNGNGPREGAARPKKQKSLKRKPEAKPEHTDAKSRTQEKNNIHKKCKAESKAESKAEDPRDGEGSGAVSAKTKKKQRVNTEFWPFEVDYNDHFETSFRAIQDLQPILQLLCKKLKKPASALAVYDPFFCKGGIRRHYEALGFTNFIHRNRDFYKDVESGDVPPYDILVTNPPYSSDHKERILEFCLGSGRPWALLLPNYVATKAYFSELLTSSQTPPTQRPFFLTPNVRYSYDHPEGTGHAESPFFSIWYVGLEAHTEAVYGACRARLEAATGPAADGGSGRKPAGKGAGTGASWNVKLALSVDALRQAKAVPTARRLNPKQRMRLKKQKHKQPGQGQQGD